MDVYIAPDERARANAFLDRLIQERFRDAVPTPEQEADFFEALLADGLTTVPLMDGSQVTLPEAEPRTLPTSIVGEASRAHGANLALVLFLVGFVLLAYLAVGRDLIASRRASRSAGASDHGAVTIGDGLDPDYVALPAGLDAIVTSGDVRVKAVYPATMEIRPGDGRPPRTYVVVPVSVEVADWPCPQPKEDVAACWVYGTVINYLIGIPADARAQALAQALQSYGGEIVLRLSTGAAHRYTVSAVQDVGRQETEVLTQQRPGVTVPLLGAEGSRRTVITAVYVADFAAADAVPHGAASLTEGGEPLQIYITLGMEASAGAISVLPRQLGRSGDTQRLALRVTNRSDRHLQPETWAPQGWTMTEASRAVTTQGTVGPGEVGEITLSGEADIAVWGLTIGNTQIHITGGN